MTQADMVEWADQGVTQLSRSVAALRNGADPQELEATTDGLVVVTVVLEELVRRR
ncbi:hypothetical protein ACIOEX_20550 [Streptomyces sp. NPDC087850]|uniref:hypothetical protein n=1 Tax=Streptomyces sp. NPDC087850 TaxID=3365809 RepID=UPI0037F3BB07